MSVVWHHQPAHYTTPNVSQFWSAAHADVTVDATNGYGSTPALSGSSLSAYVRRDFLSAVGMSFGLGCRIKIQSLPATEKILMGVTDATGVLVVCVSVLADGRLAVYRGALDALLGIYTGPVTTAAQVRLGLKGVIGAGTTGSIELDLAGAAALTVTGVDTGSTAWSGVYLGPGSDIYISHAYATDGNLIPAYLIDVALANDPDVGDADPDGDTTTISLAAVGDTVDVPLVAPTTRRLVYGVQHVVVATAGATEGGFAPIQTFDGIAYQEDRQTVPLTYTALESAVRTTHPATGLPLTTDDIAAMTVGGIVVV